MAERIRELGGRSRPVHPQPVHLGTHPFFNEGLIVDSDGSIHPSNVGLAGSFDDLRAQTKVGDLDDLPDLATLRAAAERTRGLLEATTPPRILQSTHAADAELTRFVRSLLPHWAAQRRARRRTRP